MFKILFNINSTRKKISACKTAKTIAHTLQGILNYTWVKRGGGKLRKTKPFTRENSSSRHHLNSLPCRNLIDSKWCCAACSVSDFSFFFLSKLFLYLKRSFNHFNNQRWWRLFKMSLTATAAAARAGKCKERKIFTEHIMKMCHRHTNLIFNLFASTLPTPSLSFYFCDMAQAVAMHARSKQQQQHIFFIHYSCSRCCFISTHLSLSS